MVLFGTKQKDTTDFEIISGVVDSMVRGLLSIIRDDVISVQDSDLYWALIIACSDRHLSTNEERDAIRTKVFGRINEAIRLTVRDRNTDSQILDAYAKRMEIPFIDALYRNPAEKTQKDGDRILGSLNDLITQIIQEVPRNVYNRSLELSWPLFTHYCAEGAIQANVDLEEIVKLRNILAIAFSLSTAEILTVARRESRDLTQRKFLLLSNMVTSCMLSWAFRAFTIDYAKRHAAPLIPE